MFQCTWEDGRTPLSPLDRKRAKGFKLITKASPIKTFFWRGKRVITYLAPLSPNPWSHTIVARWRPFGLTTWVLPNSNGLELLLRPAHWAVHLILFISYHLVPVTPTTRNTVHHHYGKPFFYTKMGNWGSFYPILSNELMMSVGMNLMNFYFYWPELSLNIEVLIKKKQ